MVEANKSANAGEVKVVGTNGCPGGQSCQGHSLGGTIEIGDSNGTPSFVVASTPWLGCTWTDNAAVRGMGGHLTSALRVMEAIGGGRGEIGGASNSLGSEA
jgi:hypothetical protein